MDIAPPQSPAVAAAAALDQAYQRRLRTPLAQLRRRCRLYLLLDGLERLMIAVLLACLGQFLLDKWLHLSADQRGVINIGITLGWFAVIYRWILWPLMRPLTDAALAAMVDRRHPELSGRLATAVQFAAGRHSGADAASPRLIRAVIAEACEAAIHLPFTQILDHRRARRRILELAGWLGLVLLAFIVSPTLFKTWFQRNWLMREIPWPQHTYIVAQGFDSSGQRRFPRGDEVQIEATVEGETPDAAELHWWTPSGRSGRDSMTLIGRTRLVADLGTFNETIHFQITGGDERTRQYSLIGIERPRIERTNIAVRPPPYTGLQPFAFAQQTSVEFPQGSQIEIDAELNKPVATATLVGPPGDIAVQESESGRALRVKLDGPPTGAYNFVLRDADGWEDRRPLRFLFKSVTDAAPKARLTAVGVSDGATPVAEIPLEVQVEDDYGLSSVTLFAQRRDDPPIKIELPAFSAGQRRLQASATLPVATLAAQPGETLRIWVVARDNAPAKPQETISESQTISVVTTMELLTRITARELELRREFERLLSQQRTVRSALERAVDELIANPTPVLARLAGLARQQDNHAGRCLALRRQFEQLLSAMRVNRIARAGDEKRITDRITAPLDDLGRARMPAAAAAITAVRNQPQPAPARLLPPAQAEIVQEMQSVLAAMSEWEGFREAVTLLEEIISDQTEVKRATGSTVEDQLDAILGGDNSDRDSPSRKPQP